RGQEGGRACDRREQRQQGSRHETKLQARAERGEASGPGFAIDREYEGVAKMFSELTRRIKSTASTSPRSGLGRWRIEPIEFGLAVQDHQVGITPRPHVIA